MEKGGGVSKEMENSIIVPIYKKRQ